MSEVLMREQAMLDLLRARYEGEGRVFISRPPRDLVPAFLGDYQPDAIVTKPGENLIIEIKSTARAASSPKLAELAGRVSSQPGWKLLVVRADELKHEIAPSTTPEFGWAIAEFEQVRDAKQYRAALLLGWAILESMGRFLLIQDSKIGSDAMSATRLAETLENLGATSSSDGRLLRSVALLRNRVAHGDLGAVVDDRTITFLSRQIAMIRASLQRPSAPLG